MPYQQPGDMLILLLTLTLTLTGCHSITQCDKLGQCACQTEDGVINLAPLASSPPRSFPGLKLDETFYWSPCKSFDIGTVQNAGLAQKLGSEYFLVGTNSDPTTFTVVSDTGGKAVFVMVSFDSTRFAQISCNCDKSQTFNMVFQGETSGNPITYMYELTSAYCCPGYAPPSGGDGISTGTVMVLGFTVVLAVYLVAGVVFQVGVKKASGKEVIPNHGFWGTLPGLVVDGLRFTISCGAKKQGYSSI